MNENNLARNPKSFEELKQTNQFGGILDARDLQPLLGYNHWRSFDNAITKAITSCEKSGNEPGHYFVRVRKMISLGKGGEREVPDYHLSRFACYLIAQNGDPRKPEIANAQKYFAVQTRRQEVSDILAADMERLEMRKQASEDFRAYPGPPVMQGFKIKCSEFFTMPATRDFMAAKVLRISRNARVSTNGKT